MGEDNYTNNMNWNGEAFTCETENDKQDYSNETQKLNLLKITENQIIKKSKVKYILKCIVVIIIIFIILNFLVKPLLIYLIEDIASQLPSPCPEIEVSSYN